MITMTDNGLFSTWAPMQTLGIQKGQRRGSPNGGGSEALVGRIGGIISSQTQDQQGEELIQTGLDWGYFLSKGFLNYEHQQGPENILGHPEGVSPTTYKGHPATKMVGVLYLHDKRARDIFEKAKAMEKAQSPRRIGFSVEGQVQQRLGKRVLKARVLNVAVTAHPVHPDARLEILAKALDAGGAIGYQHAATPAAGAPLSPLVPQSLEATPSIATYGRYAMEQRRMSVSDLATVLTGQFPHLFYDEALKIARELARVVG